MKSNLAEKIGVFLLKNNFTVRYLTGCFDIVARRDSNILLIKVLEDANSITEEYAKQILRISSYVKGSPLVIAEKAGSLLRDNVVYMRFNVFTLNLETFKNSIRNKFPFVIRTKAGLTALIDGKKLKQLREDEGISLGNLSAKTKVSKRMIQRYESENSEITLDKAYRFYDIFGDRVFNKIDIFREIKEQGEQHSLYSKKYSALGFDASDTRKAPFDVIAKKGPEIILTELGDKSKSSQLSKLLDADNLIIYKRKKPKDVPALKKNEFMEFESANELIKFLKEFQ